MSSAARRIHVITTAAPPARDLPELVERLRRAGRECCVIATPTASTWIDTDQMRARTGHPVRVHPRLPDEADPLPAAGAVLAAPLTFNSLNKWAHGISDTLALGVLNEALGAGLPITAAPVVKTVLRSHPAYTASMATLRGRGVAMLDPDSVLLRRSGESTGLDWARVVHELAVSELAS